MKSTAFVSLALALTSLLSFATVSAAGELDPAKKNLPAGLIARVSPQGSIELFRADVSAAVASEGSAQDAVAAYVKTERRVNGVKPVSELDRETSHDSWYYWYSPYSYNYSYAYNYAYYYGGTAWNYYPYYRWQTPGYSYYFYRYY